MPVDRYQVSDALPGSALASGQGPSGAAAHKGWTLALASVGAFLTSLDVVVVATALPTLRTSLNASLADLEWTINAYNLVFACLMLTGAALGDRYGRRRTYVLGLLLFTAASAAAALSTTVTELILWRIVQGAGAAIVLPLSLTLISEAFPIEKRGAAIGMWGGVGGLGIATGPVVGGVIVEGLSWQWIFWINVPIGLVVAGLCMLRLKESHGPRPQLDIRGLLLVGAGMAALTWGAVRAPAAGWSSGEVIGAFTAGVLLILAFLGWEKAAPYPMLPLAYFRRRGFSAANGVAFFQFISLLGSLFMITQLFQVGLGYSPLEAGVRILVWMAMPMLVAPIAGALADKFGNKPFMLVGLILQGSGLGWLAVVVEPGVGYGLLIGPLIISGIGISMCFPTVANAVVLSVPLQDSGVAAGSNTAMRELGGVFGIAIVAAVFAANGSYDTPIDFIDGFRATMIVAALVPLLGVVAAAFAPSRDRERADAAAMLVSPRLDETASTR